MITHLRLSPSSTSTDSCYSAPAVAVTAASGGCGVTTVAIHIARHYQGFFVEGASSAGAAERLALDRAGLRTWSVGDLEGESLRLAALPMAGGFRALFAPSAGWDLAEVTRALLRANVPVVADVPAGTGLPEWQGPVALVMPATMPGAARARGLLGDLPPGARAVVVNRLGPGGETTRARLQSAVGTVVATELPCCAALRDAEDDGTLAARRTRWGRRVERLAASLAGAASA